MGISQGGESYRYRRADQDVQMLMADTWVPARLRAWHLRETGWWAFLVYTPEGAESRVDWVAATRVRGAVAPGAADGLS